MRKRAQRGSSKSRLAGNTSMHSLDGALPPKYRGAREMSTTLQAQSMTGMYPKDAYLPSLT